MNEKQKGKGMKRHLVFLLPILLWSCFSEPDEMKLLDDLVVSTNYDVAAAFNGYSTYFLPTDTIGLVSNVVTDDTIIVNNFSRMVVGEVKSHMDARGYVLTDKTLSPDLALNVYVVKDFNMFQQVMYGGYGGYGGYYYPSYYGYSSYYSYYPVVNTYAYNTGVLAIEIVDRKNITPDKKVKVIWVAYMGDIYNTVDLGRQTKEGISQAFVQSPYIQRP